MRPIVGNGLDEAVQVVYLWMRQTNMEIFLKNEY